MRKFSITSQEFEGEIFVEYNEFGVLDYFDARLTKFNGAAIGALLNKLPKDISKNPKKTLQDFLDSLTKKVHMAECSATFDAFWEAYGKKINKKRTEKLWNKLSEKNKLAAIRSIAQYDRFLKYKEPGRAKADPETYLRNEMFFNEWNKR